MNYEKYLAYVKSLVPAFPNLEAAVYSASSSLDSAVERVPDEFIKLLPHVLPVLQKNVNDFCQPDEVLVIVGLQPAAEMFSFQEGKNHFCCTLDFYRTSTKAFEVGTHCYNKTDSVIIDFTSGRISSVTSFLDLMDPPGTAYNAWLSTAVYGVIPELAVDAAWSSIKQNLFPCKAQRDVKNDYSEAHTWFREHFVKPDEKSFNDHEAYQIDVSISMKFSPLTQGRFFPNIDAGRHKRKLVNSAEKISIPDSPPQKRAKVPNQPLDTHEALRSTI